MDCDSRNDDKGNLQEESPTPADGLGDKATKDTAKRSTCIVEDGTYSLQKRTLTEGHEIVEGDGGEGGETGASNTGDNATKDKEPEIIGDAAEEATKCKDSVGEDEKGLAAKDVRELAVERLAGGDGDEVGGRYPGDGAELFELGRYVSEKGCDNCTIEGREKDTDVEGDENDCDGGGVDGGFGGL